MAEASAAADAGRGPRVGARRELVQRQIMEQATRLFAERGLAGTTLQDIADATGLTRPALYHYVSNKEDLFARLVSEIVEEPASTLQAINASDQDPAAKLRDMATSLATHQMRTQERFRLLVRSEAELPEPLAETYRKSRRHVLKELITVVEAGMAGGQFVPGDSRTRALGIVGMLNWIAWWHRPDGNDVDTSVAQVLADMAVRSLSAAPQGSGDVGPTGVIDRMREQLDYLERALAHDEEHHSVAGKSASEQ